MKRGARTGMLKSDLIRTKVKNISRGTNMARRSARKNLDSATTVGQDRVDNQGFAPVDPNKFGKT